MKKLFIYILAFVIIAGAAYAAYRYYLPSKVAGSLTSEEPSGLVPAEVQDKITSLKDRVTHDVGDLPRLMNESGITYADLKNMLDRVDPREVADAVLEMSSIDITSVNQAFDVIKKNVSIEGYDLERFREIFVQNSDVRGIQEAMEKVREYDYLVKPVMPVVKEIAKDLLEQSKPEIEARLAEMDS